MDYDTYTSCTVVLAVDLVNTHPAHGDGEALPDPSALTGFVRRHFDAPPRSASAADLRAVHEVRDRLRTVFAAAEPAEAAAALNRLLDDSAALPQLTDHDGSWHLHFAPGEAPLAARIAAEAAMGIAGVLCDGGFDRLRTCAADGCAAVFVDASRNRSRRYCDPDTCGNRVNVAAFRARQRAEADTG